MVEPLIRPRGLERARAIADRLRSVVPDAQTVSAGVACWDGIETLGALIARSDAALYSAKAAGRDRTEIAPDPSSHGVTEG